jgi:hypothetical protein
MNKLTVVAWLMVLACGAVQAQTQRQFQCWTDDKGVRACGDHVPPQYAKQERQVLDSQGRVVDTKSREKTAEEVQAEAAARKLAEDMAFRKRQQEEYDRFLLETYNSEADLAHARDDRLAAIDGRIKFVNENIAANEATLKQLRDRAAAVAAAAAEKAKQSPAAAAPVPAEPPKPVAPPPAPASPAKPASKPAKAQKPAKPRTLPEQIADFEKALAESQKIAQELIAEREVTRVKFETDISRWKELKTGKVGG